MDWYAVLSLVGAFLAGSYWGERRAKKSRKLEYEWDCLVSGCVFHVGSTNPEFTLKLADDHMEKVHGKATPGS